MLLVGIGLFLMPAGATLLGMTSTQLAVMGAGMLLAGVSSLLTKTDEGETKDDNSFQFQGSIPMARQGSPVPLFYGRGMVKQPGAISGGVSSYDIAFEKSGGSRK